MWRTTWSPDGTALAYASELTGWYEVFLVEVGERTAFAPRRLTHDDADFGELRFTAAGTELVGVRSRRGVSDLVRIDVASGQVSVVAAGGTWSSPSPLADGSVPRGGAAARWADVGHR